MDSPLNVRWMTRLIEIEACMYIYSFALIVDRRGNSPTIRIPKRKAIHIIRLIQLRSISVRFEKVSITYSFRSISFRIRAFLAFSDHF